MEESFPMSWVVELVKVNVTRSQLHLGDVDAVVGVAIGSFSLVKCEVRKYFAKPPLST